MISKAELANLLGHCVWHLKRNADAETNAHERETIADAEDALHNMPNPNAPQMKLYLIKMIREVDWQELEACVIAAKDEELARAAVKGQDEIGNHVGGKRDKDGQIVGGTYYGDRDFWMKPENATCCCIAEHTDEPAGTILRSVNWG